MNELRMTDLSASTFLISIDDSKLQAQVEQEGRTPWNFGLSWTPQKVKVKPEVSRPFDDQKCQLASLRLVEAIFGHDLALKQVEVEDPLAMSWDRVQFFMENPQLWVKRPEAQEPDSWTKTQDIAHPVRPVPQPGQLYRRWIPQLGKTLSFELFDFEKHLAAFHSWQNQDRVAKFWEINKPIEELRAYIEKVHADPHHIPVIGEIDGVPVGYFEVYWTLEDRLGPYYDAGPYDRGFHMLIGNTDFLGGPYTFEFLRALGHWIFLDEPRTERIMAEPRSDNKKMLRYVDAYPVWKNLREFDFPHKRACLLEFAKDRFLKGGGL